MFDMAGRFAWSSTSDVVGRKPIHMLAGAVPRGEGPGTAGREHAMNQTVRLVVSWALVPVLPGYGVIQTPMTAAKLFT